MPPTCRPTPRTAAIVAWVLAHAADLEAIDYGELVFRWHAGQLRAIVQSSELVPVLRDGQHRAYSDNNEPTR